MKTVLMINPHAGRQQIEKEVEQIRRCLEQAGGLVQVARTESREQAGQIVCRAAQDGAGLLVCCGGDGTLSDTVNHLLSMGLRLPLGYIPAGSTNDFAAALHIPREPEKAAALIASGSPQPLDVGRFGARYFIYVASFGAFTQTSYNTTQSLKNTFGHFAYVLESVKELPAIKSYHVKVETGEGGAYEGDYIFGSVSNSTSLGGVIKLDPAKVDMTDGEFELTLVKMPRNLLEFNRMIFSLMSGKYDEELITFVHTRRASFTCAEPMPWSLDGEYAAGGERVELEVVPQAVQLFY